MDQPSKSPKDVPISAFLAISLIIVYSLYITSAIKSKPCNKDLTSVFMSNFIHSDWYHLTGNLYALYALSRVERRLKPLKFFSLVLFLLFFTSIIEVMLHKMNPDMNCSIGFSGVLFGITTWELVTKQQLDFYLISSIFVMIITPSLKDKKISLTGHTVGALSGIIGGIIWNKLGPLIIS